MSAGQPSPSIPRQHPIPRPRCQPRRLVSMRPEHFSRVKQQLKCCVERGHAAGKLRSRRVVSQTPLRFLWTRAGSYFWHLCCVPGLREPIPWQGCSLPTFGNPEEVREVLSEETDKGLKLNCNIKFCCELSHQWYFIMASFCQLHCYCLISITSTNTSSIYIYAKFGFLLPFAWVLEIALRTFPIAALFFLVGEPSIA